MSYYIKETIDGKFYPMSEGISSSGGVEISCSFYYDKEHNASRWMVEDVVFFDNKEQAILFLDELNNQFPKIHKY